MGNSVGLAVQEKAAQFEDFKRKLKQEWSKLRPDSIKKTGGQHERQAVEGCCL